MNCLEFYNDCCQKTEDDRFVLLQSRINKLKIDKEENGRHSTSLKTVFRYVNPKVDGNKILNEHIKEDDLPDDFDMVLDMLESSNFKKYKINFEKKELFFLPSDLENTLKNVLYGNKTKKIPSILKQYIPQKLQTESKLEFIDEIPKIIEYNETSKYSISFFKTFKSEEEEANLEESIHKINKIKNEVKPDFIEEFDYYFIGEISNEPNYIGLLEKKKKHHFPDPLTYHYNFWMLPQDDISKFLNKFELKEFN